MIENSALGITMLRRDQTMLTREEHHQPALAADAPGRHGSRREVVVELASCRIVAGKYAGQRGIEARLDGERIGELTHRMSQRYLPHVDAVVARGARPACEAVLFNGPRGIEAELRLPGPPKPSRHRGAGTGRRPLRRCSGVAAVVWNRPPRRCGTSSRLRTSESRPLPHRCRTWRRRAAGRDGRGQGRLASPPCCW